MKKLLLLASFVTLTCSANAQGSATPFVLTGTSYTQDFNSLTSLETFPSSSNPQYLPDGWECDTAASASSTGGAHRIWKYPTVWPYFGGQFGNYASGTASTLNGVNSIWDTTLTGGQNSAADRALGVRQVSNTSTKLGQSDPGAAFTFKIANTTGRTGFNLTFHLQSLDTTSSKICHWTVDYGIGTTPTTFTQVPSANITGGLTTGVHHFSDSTITVNFGNALDNQSSNVWIRIVCLVASDSGACYSTFCNRATTAIDNYNLTWGNTSVENISSNSNLDLVVVGAAMSNKITLAYNAKENGKYNMSICDLTGRQVYNQIVNIVSGSQNLVIDGLDLNKGMYIVKMSNDNVMAVAKAIIQ
ncbi:MAG: T9SS type A sorting domain-containing protein [Bacteroidota bacterium]